MSTNRNPVSPRRRVLRAAGLLALAATAAVTGARAATLTENGTFRLLTETLPVGTTNAEYVARLLTVNSDGPVTFSVDPATPLAPGMLLDATTGYITGRPTSTYNQNITLQAADGTNTAFFVANLKVNASGGGGNEGSTFGGFPLAEGRVGTPYTHTVSVQNGVGPYVFGATALPSGIVLDGLTGTLSGTPVEAGTFFVELTVTDHGENANKVITVAPLVVLPAGSDLKFATTILGNGEVGTPYCETWTLLNPGAAATFAASGLPTGLTVDQATGVVSGTPEVAGTFDVGLTAVSGGERVSTNLQMIVVPSSTSSFRWDFSGVPSALVNVLYTRQPSIQVATANGTTVTYAAVGLPTGITYDALTGELAGIASEVGEFPVVFTATDSTSGHVLTYVRDFLVLPPDGGDVSDLAVNCWPVKMKVKTGKPGEDSWKGFAIYNADRRTASAFDPSTQAVALTLGASEFRVDAGSFIAYRGALLFQAPRGTEPKLAVQCVPKKQIVGWRIGAATFPETLPGELRPTTTIGSRGYRLETFVNDKGKLAVPEGIRRATFVVWKGTVRTPGNNRDSVELAFLLADPALAYEPGVSQLRLRLFEGPMTLVDRDFTLLGAGGETREEPVGSVDYAIKTLEDEATTARVAKCSFKGKTGKGTIHLDLLTLPVLTDAEAHLGVELTIGTRVYFTSVTSFERKTSIYSVP